jgi:hypothetical protein
MLNVDRMAEAREALSFARTALDDPAGLPENVDEILMALAGIGGIDREKALVLYAIDRIDDAIRLLESA